MTITNPSEGQATIFVWLAEQIKGGMQRAFGWGWDRGQWFGAQHRYMARVSENYGSIRVIGQTEPWPLQDIFTDVYLLDQITAWRRFGLDEMERRLRENEAAFWRGDRERQSGEALVKAKDKLFILGKPGAGKTTFLRHLAVRAATNRDAIGKVPIFVPLVELAREGESLWDVVLRQFDICGFPDARLFVEALLQRGWALVLFDGLDEVPQSEDRRQGVTNEIRDFARKYKDNHIVVTCRIAATDYQLDQFTYAEMADFSPEQVGSFVRNWFLRDATARATGRGSERAEAMLSELDRPEHDGMRDLTRSPLLLALLCLNYETTLAFPTRRVEIYEEALDELMKRWDARRNIKRDSRYKQLSLGRKRQLFEVIAYETYTQNRLLMPQRELEERIVAYLATVPEMPAAIDIDGEIVLKEIEAQHSILSAQAQNIYAFSHKTFHEYFAAKYIVNNAAAGTLDELLLHCTDDNWREVFLLTASLLPQADAFFAQFQQALHTVLRPQPRLTSLLRQIEQAAAVSQAGYRQPATRGFFLTIARDPLTSLSIYLMHHLFNHLYNHFDRDPYYDYEDIYWELFFEHARGSSLSLDLAVNLDRIIGLDRAFSCDCVLDGEDALKRGISGDLALKETVTRLINRSQEQGRFALADALAQLPVPGVDAGEAELRAFADCLDAIVKKQLKSYRQLEREAVALAANTTRFDDVEIEALFAYLKGCGLYYDCLQVAVVSNRTALEDWLFTAPPEVSTKDDRP